MNSNEKTRKNGKRLQSAMEKIINPKPTLFGMKNFHNAVDFHPKEMICKNTWSRDLTSTHIRNKRLLDLPYVKPKCCADIYNIAIDRQKQKKLKRYNLSRPVRCIASSREEEVKLFKSECVPYVADAPKARTVIVPECYLIQESDSDNDEYAAQGNCKSESVCECKKPPDCGEKYKIHKVKRRGEASDAFEIEFCKEKIKKEIEKHKLGEDFNLQLENVFN